MNPDIESWSKQYFFEIIRSANPLNDLAKFVFIENWPSSCEKRFITFAFAPFDFRELLRI
jgi:hypothetical protein